MFPVLRVNIQKTLYLKEENKKESEKNVYRFTTTLPPPFDKTFFWQYRPIEIPDKHKLNSCGKVTCLFFFISYFSISIIKESEFFQIRKQYLFTVVNKVFKEPRKMLFEKLETMPSVGLIGDGRYDSPDFNAKYDTDTSCCEKIKL